MFHPDSLTMLEYPAILEMLASYAHSDAAIARARALAPFDTPEDVALRTAQTASARGIFEAQGAPPLYSMEGMNQLKQKISLGDLLTIDELRSVGMFLNHCRLLRRYMERAAQIDRLVAGYGLAIEPVESLREEIERTIRGDGLDDHASPKLYDIRMRKARIAEKVKEKLASLLRAHPAWFQESYHSVRSGRYVLPVKREYRAQINGRALDSSGSGATVFIEPDAVAKLHQELDQLDIDEGNEVFRILSSLSADVADHGRTLSLNREAMEEIDYCFACGRLGNAMSGVSARPTRRREMMLDNARHPLLGPGAVPLSVALGQPRALVITGPNTGGKTVALKTVGLLTLMALSGLQVPARDAVVPQFSGVWCDIGDGQSIQQSLSTFSSHVTRIVGVLREADGRSLVLLDELGSGTDPQEGMGLAVAVLEELGRRQCLMVATSHYPDVKHFAAKTPGFVNGRMTFNRATLSPEYRLEMGEAGESCALYIAQRLGVPQGILDRAWKAAYGAMGALSARGREAAQSALDGGYALSALDGGWTASPPSAPPAREGGGGSFAGDTGIDGFSDGLGGGAGSRGDVGDAMEGRGGNGGGVQRGPTASGTPAGGSEGAGCAAASVTVGAGRPAAADWTDRAGKHGGAGMRTQGDAPARTGMLAHADGPAPEDMPVAAARPEDKPAPRGAAFALGDRVFVTSMRTHGVISKLRNSRGELGVRIQGKNFTVPENRLRLYIGASELYPGEDYDLSIVLNTWDERKAQRDVRKGKKGASITIREGSEDPAGH